MTTTQVTNASSPYVGSIPEPAATAPEGFSFLTPDALMGYCQTRLQSVDSQMENYFDKEQANAQAQSVLTKLEAALNNCTANGFNMTGNHAGTDLIVACQNAIKELPPGSPAIQQIQQVQDSITQAMDPSGTLTRALTDPQNTADFMKVYASQVGPTGGFNDQQMLQDMTGDSSKGAQNISPETVAGWQKSVESAGSDLNNDSQMGMIQLQSLMSDRQTSIQMCTNLVQALADQSKAITSNIGH